MTLEDFIKTIALNLLESDCYSINSQTKEYKLGIIYETKKLFVVPYYEFHDDSCVLRVTKYDCRFEEVSSKSFESEESAGIYLSKMKNLKESGLNKELAMLFGKISMFVKQKDSKVIN